MADIIEAIKAIAAQLAARGGSEAEQLATRFMTPPPPGTQVRLPTPDEILAGPAAQLAGFGPSMGVAGAIKGRLTPEEIAQLYARYKAVAGQPVPPTTPLPSKPMTPEEIERLYEAWKNPFKTKGD